jgi:chromosome partitioning protein
MPTIAIAHQAGGVGKTTTAVNLGYCLAEAGKRVLLVDMDPQHDLTIRLNVQGQWLPTLEEALIGPERHPAIVTREFDNGIRIDVLPSGPTLRRAELQLVGEEGREQRLRQILRAIGAGYDYILIDCPPNLGLLTVNAFYAADSVLIPIQAQDKAYQALPLVLTSLEKVNTYRPTPLTVLGLLVTMWEHTSMARDVHQQINLEYPDWAMQTIIPTRTGARYDSRNGAPVADYDPRNPVAVMYHELAREVMHRVENTTAAHV